MEKQLLLKEAATRKKLLALKQQLQADNGLQSTNKLLGKEQKEASSKSTADHLVAKPKTAQSETLHTDERDDAIQLSLSVSGNWPTRPTMKSQPSPPVLLIPLLL